MSDKTDFIDEIYVPRKNMIEVFKDLETVDHGHTEVVRDICPTPISDFIDEVYVPKKKETSEKLNN